MSRTLPLLLDELFDLDDAIDELDRRRAKLRAAVLDELQASGEAAFRHPRGTARIVVRRTVKVPQPSSILGALIRKGWVDDVVSIRGAPLLRFAVSDLEAWREIQPHVRESTARGLRVTGT